MSGFNLRIGSRRQATQPPRPRDCDDRSALQVRKPRRKAIDLPCRVASPGQSSVQAILNDLSWRGFRVTCPVTVMIGTVIQIELPLLGLVPARVRWALGGQAGGVFEKPLPAQLFEHPPYLEPVVEPGR